MLLRQRTPEIPAIAQNAWRGTYPSRYSPLRISSQKNEEQNEENFCDARLAVAPCLGNCTNNARANQERGQQRSKRHLARSAEKHHRSRRGHACRQI